MREQWVFCLITNARKIDTLLLMHKKITYDLTIYPYHIDFMQHVSNIVYVEWMEIGRCLLLDAVGMSVAQIAKQGFGPVLAETQISYKKALVLGNSVRVELWITALSRVTGWMSFQFFNEHGELVATGRQRGLFVNISTGKPQRITDEERAKLAVYLESSST
jgi:acyl-CoA thioester hydrolase